jgi:hypothetical protein
MAKTHTRRPKSTDKTSTAETVANWTPPENLVGGKSLSEVFETSEAFKAFEATLSAQQVVTGRRARALHSELDAIDARYTGPSRKARRLAAQLTYAADVIDGSLCDEDVREGNRGWIERLWLAASPFGKTADTLSWNTLFAALDLVTEHPYVEPLGDRCKDPRCNDARCNELRTLPGTHVLFTAANGIECVGRYLTAEQTAHMMIERLGKAQPELARRLDVAKLAAVLPLWNNRRKSGGRRPRKQHLWSTVRDLGTSAGLAPIDERAIQSIRERHEERKRDALRQMRDRRAKRT